MLHITQQRLLQRTLRDRRIYLIINQLLHPLNQEELTIQITKTTPHTRRPITLPTLPRPLPLTLRTPPRQLRRPSRHRPRPAQHPRIAIPMAKRMLLRRRARARVRRLALQRL